MGSYPYTFHYGKREAEAEPEAEADPALIYTTNTLPLTSAVHSPLVSGSVYQPIVYNSAVQTPVVYKTLPVAEKTEKVSTPLVYTHPMIYNTALKTPFLSKVFPSLKTFTTPLVSHITKREAEADPALVYTTAGVHQPIVYKTPFKTPVVYNTAVQQPIVYKTAVQTPLVYNTPVHTPLLKTVDNAVVPAVGGYIHSSHVGVCTNNVGIRVPC